MSAHNMVLLEQDKALPAVVEWGLGVRARSVAAGRLIVGPWQGVVAVLGTRTKMEFQLTCL